MAEMRALPSVHEILGRLGDQEGFPQKLITEEVRAVLAERRACLREAEVASEEPVEVEVRRRLAALMRPSLRGVINATGIILHTNLGRAALGDFQPIQGWSNLEFDLATGKRGKRDAHTAGLMARLLGVPGIIVNNNAAAVFLVLHEVAQGGEAIVSRGELIEIGDGFRIPEIMTRAGTILREVGTTNRTRIEDYRDAINERTRVILRVHPSNFHISGFAARPDLRDLCQLGKERCIPVYEDLGSGCLVDLRSAGIREPLVANSLAAGVNVVSFSCDKLLGGPQSGIIAGNADFVARIRRNPMYRALRVDKLIVEAMERSLRLLLLERWSEIPTLRAIFAGGEELRLRAERVAAALGGATVRPDESPIGGGSTPDQTLRTWLVELRVEKPHTFAAELRKATTPVIARISDAAIVFDMRTVADGEVRQLVESVQTITTAASTKTAT